MNKAGALYKVLIVDDEILVIQFLENLICWEELGCKVVGTVTTGRRALQLSRDLQPDIIFMDIKMPGTDGLTLSRKIRKEICRAEIIILTAYADFEFAQEALKMGIRDYLLKNQVDEQALRGALKRVIEEIRRKDQLYVWRMEQWMKKGWEEEIQGDPPVEIEETSGTFRILLAKQQMLFGKIDKINEGMTEKDRLPSEIIGSTDVDSGILFLIRIGTGKSERYMREVYQRIGIQQLQNLQDTQTGHWMGIYSQPFSDIKKYQETCRVLKKMRQLTFFQRHFLVFPEEYEKLVLHRPVWPQRPKEYMRKKILEYGNIEKALRETMKAWEPDFLIEETDLPSLTGLEMEDFSELPMEIRRCAALSDLVRNEGLLREYLCGRNHEVLFEHSRKVYQTIIYIQKHFEEDISSSVIAGILQVSDGYLRKIFKQETGMTIKEFLIQYRMKQARKFLQSGKYNISETAALCGFKTSQHFSTVFKRITGKSPGAFLNGETGEKGEDHL